MTRDEFAAALAAGAEALRVRASNLSAFGPGVDGMHEYARRYRAHADLLAGVDVNDVSDAAWVRFAHESRRRARALPPPSMLEQS